MSVLPHRARDGEILDFTYHEEGEYDCIVRVTDTTTYIHYYDGAQRGVIAGTVHPQTRPCTSCKAEVCAPISVRTFHQSRIPHGFAFYWNSNLNML